MNEGYELSVQRRSFQGALALAKVTDQKQNWKGRVKKKANRERSTSQPSASLRDTRRELDLFQYLL